MSKEKDYTIITKIDGLTKKELRELSNTIEDAKDKIAPDARGTTIKGKTNEINPNLGKEMSKKIGGNNKNVKKKK